MDRQVILLNGPSSSGKSTLAASLQDLITKRRGEHYGIVSIDDFLHMTARDVIYEDDVFAISRDLCEAALAWIQTAPGVIIDHVITSKRIFDQLTQTFQTQPLRLILVTCPPEVLREREAARGNRCPGSAEASAAWLYPKDGYDLTADTYRMTAAECARRIFDHCFPPESITIKDTITRLDA